MGSKEVGVEDNNSSSSSGEEDGDEQWRAAINAVAASSFSGRPAPSNSKLPPPSSLSDDDDDVHKPPQTHLPKHYQIKAQKTLDDILEKMLVVVKDPDPINNVSDDCEANEGGVRLFKQAPVGIVFDHRDEPKGPTKKPKILPGEEIDEKSKKFKRRLQSIVVEGRDVLAYAQDAHQKALIRQAAKETAAKDAAKREEERIARLKKIRGEKWLPSIAREMKVKSRGH